MATQKKAQTEEVTLDAIEANEDGVYVLQPEDYAALKSFVLNVVAPHSFTVTLDARSKRKELADQGLTKEQIQERMKAEAHKINTQVSFNGITLFDLFEQFVLPQTTIKCRGFSTAPSDEELEKHLATFEGPIMLDWDSLGESPWVKSKGRTKKVTLAEMTPEEIEQADFSGLSKEQLEILKAKFEQLG